MQTAEQLISKIEQNEITVGVIGLGYAGLPLAVTFARKGVNVLGFEKSNKKSDAVNAGRSYIGDIQSSELHEVVSERGFLSATTDFTRIKECDAVIICVPTPLDKFKKPDMSHIEASCIDIARNMNAGTLISLESTTYPTTTEEFIKPLIEKESGLREGRDFWLCFSPERIDPGNKDFKTGNTPKVVGALGTDARKIALALYSMAIDALYPVSSPRAAEMVKILENTYRLINISLINELALLSGKMDIDIWEVVEAAKTKPYGFHAFYPGPGIGGNCIPLDPFYLEYVAKNFNFDLTMIETAGHINNLMPHRMAIKIASALNHFKKPIKGSKILFLGVAYKPDIADDSESPALKLIEEIIRKGGHVIYHDPFIPKFHLENGTELCSVPLDNWTLQSADCVVITTSHSCFDSGMILSQSKLIVDLRNLIKTADPKIYRL